MKKFVEKFGKKFGETADKVNKPPIRNDHITMLELAKALKVKIPYPYYFGRTNITDLVNLLTTTYQVALVTLIS